MRRSIIIAVSKVVQLICEIVQRVCDSLTLSRTRAILLAGEWKGKNEEGKVNSEEGKVIK